MGQTNCPGCGATVHVVRNADTGATVALDQNAGEDFGPNRYRYVHSQREPMVRRVSDQAPGFYFRAHECIEPPAA